MLEPRRDRPEINSGRGLELQDEQRRLESLRRKLQYGHVPLLLSCLEKDAKLRMSKNPHIRKEFRAIEDEAFRGREIENVYGKGALLNLDHPFVQKLAAGGAPEGGPIIPASFVRAARAYRLETGIQGSRLT